jgi:ADP-dependent NAD(P)H-hydrate dehydratase / NAD(P)H-hydrate epimerase
MKIVTAAQMKSIDGRAIANFGIPGAVLMENAASAILVEMERFFDGLAGLKIGVICGKGNNGGDGLALARRLRNRGVAVRVVLLAPFAALAGDAQLNLGILRKVDVEVLPDATPASLADILAWSDILVDAVLGVGITSALTGDYLQAVRMINASGRPVVAVDIPTGVNADTGEVMGEAVMADLTITMALPKRGIVLHPGATHAGVVRVVDISIPIEAVEQENVDLSLLDSGFAWGLLGRRKPDAHKGDFGHLMIIAGSPGKAGAAVMAARGALRVGPGLVTVAAPKGIVPIIQQVAEAMCIPADESVAGALGSAAVKTLLRASATMTACAIGPGLSTDPETVQTVRHLVEKLAIPAVIDADGLNALAGSLDILKKARAPLVLTPHPGEMARLLGVSSSEVQKNRIDLAAEFAAEHKVTLVLKGAGTVVATSDGSLFVNSTGNPGMATGGTGDVLTGMIGGLLARGYAAAQAACLGVYLHGLAGDLAAKEKGETAMIAGDVIDKIPEAIKLTESAAA